MSEAALLSASSTTGPGRARRSRRVQRNAFLVRWHRRIALLFAVPLIIQITTGVALVFRPELVSRSVAPGDRPASFSSMMEAVSARYPDLELVRVDFPAHAARPVVVHAKVPADPRTRFIEVDPYSGAVIGEQGAGARALAFLREVHDELATPGAGPIITALTGLSLLTLAVSGLVVWWPGSGQVTSALRWPRKGTAKQLLFMWHRSLGAVAGLLLIAIAATGIPLALNSWIATTPWSEPSPAMVAARADARVHLAQSLFPNLSVRDVRLKHDQVERVLLHDTALGLRRPVNQVRFEPETGRVTGIVDSAKLSAGHSAMAWLYPLHTGQAGGYVVRVMLLATGLTAAATSLTGLWLWWVRRGARA